MTKGRIVASALLAAAGLWAVGAGSASASVEIVKVISIKDAVPSDAPAPPAAATPPAPVAPPAPRSRPGPKFGGLAGAAMAPAELGARVADFMARTITNGVTGAPAPADEKDRDPA